MNSLSKNLSTHFSVLLFIALSGNAAVAQDVATWNGAASGNWSASGNWNGSFVPNGNDVINIAGSSNLTMNNNLTGGALNQYRLFFNPGAGAFTLNGNAVTFFDFGGNNPKIENNSANTQTININVTMDGAGTGGAAEINPVDGNLFFGGTVSLADTTRLHIWGANSKTVTFNNGINASTFGSLILNQKSTTVLNGTSNFGGQGNLGNADGNITIGANPTDTGSTLSVNGTVNGVDQISLQKGSLNINSGGTLNTIRFLSSDASGATNTINHSGGTFNISGNVNSGASSSFLLGHLSAASTYNLSGGQLNSPNAPLNLGWDGAATLNQTGGTANLQGINFNNGRNNTALYSLGTGGRLNIGSYGMNGNATAKEMRLAGGILGATANWTGTQNMTVTANSEINTLDAVDGTTGRTITLNAVLSGSGGIKKTGAGTLIFAGANTYSGATEVSGGTLTVSSTLHNTSSLTVRSGATSELGATNIFVANFGTALPDSRSLNVEGGTLLFNTSFESRIGNVNLSNGATWTSNRGLTAWDAYISNVTSGAATIAVSNTGGNTSPSTMNGSGGIHLGGTVNFNVADVTGSSADDLLVSMRLDNGGNAGGLGTLNKQGAGTLLLNGQQTYTGGTLVNAGTVAVDGNHHGNRLSNNHAVTVNNNGTFEIRGVNALPSGSNAVDVTVNAGGKLRVLSGGSAAIGSGGESHAHLRNLTLNGGLVQLDYSGTGSAFQGESFVLNGNVTVGGTAMSTIQSSGTAANTGISLAGIRTFTVDDVASGVDLSVTAELQGGGGILKNGLGTLQLSGVHSFTGPVTVNAGTLDLPLNSNIASSSLLTVNSGAVLTGQGTAGSILLGNGSEFRPGSSPGIFYTGDISTSGGTSGSAVYIELGGYTPGSQYDQIQTTGTISLNGGILTVNLIDGFTPNMNDSFWIWLNDGTDTIAGTPGTFSNGPILSGPGLVSGDYWLVEYNANGDGGSVGNDIKLTYIPEPSISVLLGMLSLLGLRRRRAR